MKILCAICQSDFNLKEKEPRLLPKCGHTYCLQCLSQLLLVDKKINCKIDNSLLTNSNSIDIESFPKNVVVINLIKNQQQWRDEHQNQLRVSQDFKTNFCNIHNKQFELICKTDLQQICSDCVLFGIHKNHFYVKQQAFLQDFKEIIDKNQSKIAVYLNNQEYQQMKENEIQKVMSSLQTEKININHSITQNIDLIIQFLEQLKLNLESETNNYFLEFEQKALNNIFLFDQIQQNKLKIIEEHQKLQKEINQQTPDYHQIFQILKNNNGFENKIQNLETQQTNYEKIQSQTIKQSNENISFKADVQNIKEYLQKNIKLFINDNINQMLQSLILPKIADLTNNNSSFGSQIEIPDQFINKTTAQPSQLQESYDIEEENISGEEQLLVDNHEQVNESQTSLFNTKSNNNFFNYKKNFIDNSGSINFLSNKRNMGSFVDNFSSKKKSQMTFIDSKETSYTNIGLKSNAKLKQSQFNTQITNQFVQHINYSNKDLKDNQLLNIQTKVNKTLGTIVLNLSSNKITSKGIIEFIQKLKKNFEGQIDLQNNQIDQSFLSYFSQVMEQYPGVQVIDLWKNKINGKSPLIQNILIKIQKKGINTKILVQQEILS